MVENELSAVDWVRDAALLGAIALVWADILARTIVAPEDMPIGIVTGLAGGLFFILLLRRR